MSNSSSILRQYELISELSHQMLAQARADQWDAVIALGRNYHAAIESLRDMAPLANEDRLARKPLLAKILEDDARIRNLAAPELVRLGALLGNIKRHQSVLHAYCAPIQPAP
ncbi:MAG TPA: flagellar protein FliT [Eoetvoesiella sp.]